MSNSTIAPRLRDLVCDKTIFSITSKNLQIITIPCY